MQSVTSRARHRHLVAADGTPLASIRVPPTSAKRGTAFVAHGQAHHSASMLPTLEGLAARGWDVHATDLRGHGASSGDRAPLAHMDVDAGWERLTGDLRLALGAAFEGVLQAERLVIGPNLGAVALLEVLKDWPDLAPRIVLVAPPSRQLALMRLARGFARARLLVRSAEATDELTFHHLYSFLGAQLGEGGRLIDVVSGDREVTNALEADRTAWPTPTTGYFHEFFRGIESAWTWPDGARVTPGTRALVLYGSDDPVTSSGRFIEPMRRQLERIGIERMDARRVEGGRAGLILDEATLSISAIIDEWASAGADPSPLSPPADPVPEDRPEAVRPQRIGADVLLRLGLDEVDRDLNPDELVELCYSAVDEEERWVEILYRIAYAVSDRDRLNEADLEAVLAVVMPHWERSFRLNKQIMQAAAIGAVLENVIDRFRIGVAVVTADLEIVQSNAAFREGFAGILGRADASADMQHNLLALATDEFRARIARADGEAVLMANGEAVGFHFRPAALRQTTLQRGGASGVLILRPNVKADGRPDNSADLLQLAYGLTAAEAKVAVGVLDGETPSDLAEGLGVTIHTTRTHLRRIYEKVGVQGQTELAARLLRGPLGLVLGR